MSGNINLRTLAIVLIILTMGALLTHYVHKLISSQNTELAQKQFSRNADSAIAALNTSILSGTAIVASLQSLFHASTVVTRTEFQKFVSSMESHELLATVQALSWNSRVRVSEAGAFETMVRNDTSLTPDGYPQFKIKPAVADKTGYVVTYIEPLLGNEPAFGFDIGSNAKRRASVESARDSGQAEATAPITLQQESGDQQGFLLMLPVYQTEIPVDLSQRRSQFRGVVVAVFRIGDLVTRSSELDFAAVRLFDITADAEQETPMLLFEKGDVVAGSHSVEHTLSFGGRQWQLSFHASDTQSTDRSVIKWTVPLLGSLVTVLTAALALHLSQTQQRASNLARKLTDDLLQSNQRLQQSNDDLSRFAYVASHDLQTPARNVAMSVRLLEEALGPDKHPEVDEYLGFLNESSARMRSLISDLLLYAREGRQELALTTVDLADLMEEVRQDVAEIYKQSNASLLVGPMPVILADRASMIRVMFNLLNNAIRYAKEGLNPVVEVTASISDGFCEIRVKDNGQGIEQQFQESIFEPFKRLHRQDDIPGSGLGLSICKQIAGRHGGDILVESSSYEEGTVMLIRLPQGVD